MFEKLPVHPTPLPNEILTSWITRVAIANGLFDKGLYRTTMQLDRSTSMKDNNVYHNQMLISALSRVTGQSESTLRSMMLTDYVGRVFGEMLTSSTHRWALPHRHKGNILLRSSSTYCPECLRTDRKKYFRKYWKLSFYTKCHIHGCFMRDECPNCGAIVAFERTIVGQKTLDMPLDHVGLCWKCTEPLWTGAHLNGHLPECSESIEKAYAKFLTDFVEPKTIPPIQGVAHEVLLFNGAWIIASALLRRMTRGVLLGLLEQLGHSKLLDWKDHSTIDTLPLLQRWQLMTAVCWILGDWPNRLVTLPQLGKLGATAFNIHSGELPFWLEKPIKENLYQWPYYPSDEEFVAAWEYLRRTTDRPLVARDLSVLTGVHITRCRARIANLKLNQHE